MTTALPQKPFGSTGLCVSPLGLVGSGGIDADAVERAFHELGVNYFFASPLWPALSAGVLRLVRAGHRDRMVIACGAHVPIGVMVPREWALVTRGMGVGHVDVFHLLGVRARFWTAGETWPALRKLRAEGKARAIGIACDDGALAASLCDELAPDVLTIRYESSHSVVEAELFATLAGKRPGVVVSPTRKDADGAHVRFALSHPVVDVALCAPRTFEEIAEAATSALLGPLPAS
ncbi:hypothetical protein [Polyangium jinanense]|uniref:Uncharacterized protein n=1 Tax=Polyangium jinanense TaxID=2829994 RepID=A0A9X3X9H6_9BACT|nr:hypothetical protein [Polyangium jinanense]MDC3959404.1 hypothetical protein [Polyangium jinanense]MDC3984838.1 hypothetical protein [Polyangium jinanense]